MYVDLKLTNTVKGDLYDIVNEALSDKNKILPFKDNLSHIEMEVIAPIHVKASITEKFITRYHEVTEADMIEDFALEIIQSSEAEKRDSKSSDVFIKQDIINIFYPSPQLSEFTNLTNVGAIYISGDSSDINHFLYINFLQNSVVISGPREQVNNPTTLIGAITDPIRKHFILNEEMWDDKFYYTQSDSEWWVRNASPRKEVIEKCLKDFLSKVCKKDLEEKPN